jgi:DNA-binding MarR family transcriptional regulator
LSATKPASCTCARLRRASRAVTQLYDGALAEAGLRLTQFALLRTLERDGAMTIGALARRMLIDRTALSRNLDPLVARSLVAIAAGDDARQRRVALTAAGRRVIAQAKPLWSHVQSNLESRMGRERILALYDALDALEALHPAHATP